MSVSMLRKYLINIHKFYYHFYKDSMNYAIMPVIVLSLTITSFLASYDIVFNESGWINSLKSIHRLMVTVPTYLLILTLYIYYKFNLPKSLELANRDGMWNGIIICVISVIAFLTSSIAYS